MLEDILRRHAERYPRLQPCDAVKLVYQATFGGAHMIKSEAAALEYLRAEHSAIAHRVDEMRIESLGDISRIYIDAPLDECQLRMIARLSFKSAAHYPCGFLEASDELKKRFVDRLSLLQALCREGVFSFDEEKLCEYLESYVADGYPAVSHSEAYREAYSPAYRVIDSRYVRLIGLILELTRRLETNGRVVLALDGRCASGKTTAARLISELFGAQIVRMDDFFLPPELRTSERLTQIGGNLHRERFAAEVLPNLRFKDGFSYRVFDCSHGDFADEPRHIEPSSLIICEGSYALHPDFGKYYDLAAFSDVSPEEQSTRILARDGEYMLSRFKNEWIPMEEAYFDTFRIRDKADFVM